MVSSRCWPGYAWCIWGLCGRASCSPFLWTGLEYFRSELYYLRFTWLNAGYAFADHVQAVPFAWLGVYGVGFLLMLVVGAFQFFPPGNRTLAAGVAALAALGLWSSVPRAPLESEVPAEGVLVAGVQMDIY